MASFLSYKKVILLILNVMLFSAQMCLAAASDPPDFQPQLTIRYFDSQKNREVTLKKCRPGITYQVPAGTVLTLIVDVLNMSDNPCGDPVSTDIWYDWPHQKRPKDVDDADAICIPDDPGDCQQIIENLKTDFFYKGKKGKGVYHIVIWTDRFDTQTEVCEDNNYLGPIKIVTKPSVLLKKAPLTTKPSVLKKGIKIKKRK